MDHPRIKLRPTNDHESMVRLCKESGLEINELGPTLAAYGLFDGDELVGCACLKERHGVFLLECLAVAKHLRGIGLGTELVRVVESDARRRGATKMFALARSPGFFQKLGYHVAEQGEVEFPDLSACAGCPQFRDSCSPAVVWIDV